MTATPRIDRWVVDAQVLQTGARHRGMGLYALELLSALDEDGRVTLEVLLSGAFEDAEARASLARRASRARVHTLDLRADTPGDEGALIHNRGVLDAFLERSPDPARTTGFLLLSAMQGTTRPALPTRPDVPRWALVYDLIPLLFHDWYLRVPELRQEYEARLAELLRADGYLTISRTVSNDLAARLGIDPARIVTIDGAPIPAEGDPHPLPDPGHPFVLMPTGNDRRKNNRRAVAAFERFNAAHGHRYLLLITSTFEPDDIAMLGSISPGARFTGNVSGAQLADLYRRAVAVLFPPMYEGLGLPVLEALALQTPVACSDIPVFREISTEAMVFFDPESVTEMSDALTRAVAAGPPPDEITAPVLRHYRWGAVAARLVTGAGLVAAAPARLVAGAGPDAGPAKRPAVTVVGPELGADRGAATVLAATHSELGRVAAVSWAVEASVPQIGRYGYLTAVLSAQQLRPGVRISADDPVVYLLDGSAACANILLLALGLAGTVVLLETDLSDAWAAAVGSGLVTASRVDMERRLRGFEVPGTAHVAALLAASQAVLVPTDADHARLDAVARRIGVGTRIVTVGLPWPPLPFPELLPAPDRAFVELPEPRPARLNGEYVADLRLARSAAAVMGHPDPVSVLRALGHGATPVLPTGHDVGVPDSLLLLGPDDPAVLRQLADDLAGHPERRCARAEAGLEHIARRHAPRRFVRDLLAALPGAEPAAPASPSVR